MAPAARFGAQLESAARARLAADMQSASLADVLEISFAATQGRSARMGCKPIPRRTPSAVEIVSSTADRRSAAFLITFIVAMQP